MAIEITSDERDHALQSLKRYFREEMDDDLSDLRARLLLDFILSEIAPLAYNRAVTQAEEFLRHRLEDLTATCFEPPFCYWQRKKRT